MALGDGVGGDMKNIEIEIVGGEPRLDSRFVSYHLGVKHNALIRFVDNNFNELSKLGVLRCRWADADEKDVLCLMLNEDHTLLLLARTRQIKKARLLEFKIRKAFIQSRAELLTDNDYPYFHDQLAHCLPVLSQHIEDSDSEKLFSLFSFNALVHRALGVPTGKETSWTAGERAQVTACNLICSNIIGNGLAGGLGYEVVYQQVKTAISEFARAEQSTALPEARTEQESEGQAFN